MTRVATAANEELLLSMARQTTAAQLERICRLHRQVRPDGSAESIERDHRYVRARETDDGMVSIQLRLLPSTGGRTGPDVSVDFAESPRNASSAILTAPSARLPDSAQASAPARKCAASSGNAHR